MYVAGTTSGTGLQRCPGVLTARDFLDAPCFPMDQVRLFYTQQQLFDFIDISSRNSGEGVWLPFSLELDSAASAAKVLAERFAALEDTLNGGPKIFSRSRKSKRRDDLENDRASGVLAEGANEETLPGAVAAGHFSSTNSIRSPLGRSTLLGERLSEQSRFFLAVRRSFVHDLQLLLPMEKRHLYEIIREDRPCHLYLDVEQEYEYTATPEFDKQHTAGDDGVMLNAAARLPGFCPLQCLCRPRSSATTDVLLRKLREFLDIHSGLGISLQDAEIIVMRSVPIADLCTSHKTLPSSAKKFSQHYVLRFRNKEFRSNADVGALVREFVAWLNCVSADDELVHEALFFHGEPRRVASCASCAENDELHMAAVMPTPPECCLGAVAPAAAPHVRWMPRKCVIDCAVYSRNRMLRCLGSTKLGKSSILVLDPTFHGLREGAGNHGLEPHTVDEFLRTLVVADGSAGGPGQEAHGMFVPMENMTFTYSNGPSLGVIVQSASRNLSSLPFMPTATEHWRRGSSPVPSPFPLVDDFVLQEARRWARHPNSVALSHYRLVQGGQREGSGSATTDTSAAPTILYAIHGTRYCHNVAREHKSNSVYYVASLAHATIVQKCFDPDCHSFRSSPLAIPVVAIPLNLPKCNIGCGDDTAQSTQSTDTLPYYLVSPEVERQRYQAARTPFKFVEATNATATMESNDSSGSAA